MYSYIKGILAETDKDSITMETGGIGYHIFTTTQTFDSLPEIGEEIKIYTYLHIREDAMILFGFLSKEERTVFQLLLGVSGIGPKGAIAILSVMTTDELCFAILAEDAKTIAKAPGVGAKTAKRLILELKDKIPIENDFEPIKFEVTKENKNSVRNMKKEAAEALVALGYSSSEALKTINEIEITEEMDVEQLLKVALKHMAFL